MEFQILKKSKKSRARLGLLKTSSGEVETPCLVPVATSASVKTLTSQQALDAGCQILICNTFHLHTRPGEKLVQANGGLHKFMNWPRPLMTDSGGFQVFSLGFGRDLKMGKMLKGRSKLSVKSGQQPSQIKITPSGVHFRSPVNGDKLFLGPKESISIQEALGADIIFAFDECPPPVAERAYVEKSLTTTHRWAEMCLKAKKSRQALFGIVQGGKYADLRLQSAAFIGALPFAGFGIGGEFGTDKPAMEKMLLAVNQVLPQAKPRHLLGVGHPEDIPRIIRAGIDTFDCIVPTHYARHGVAFTSAGRVDLKLSVMVKDKKPLDAKCGCEVCAGYSRSYLAHLFRAHEVTALSLVTFHNLFYFNNLVAQYRRLIKQGKL
jgi:queuine tRNA-ribosyltransferase